MKIRSYSYFLLTRNFVPSTPTSKRGSTKWSVILLITAFLPGVYYADFPSPFNLDSLSQWLNKHSLFEMHNHVIPSVLPRPIFYMSPYATFHSLPWYIQRIKHGLQYQYTTIYNTLQLKNFMHSFDLLNLCSSQKSLVAVDLAFI